MVDSSVSQASSSFRSPSPPVRPGTISRNSSSSQSQSHTGSLFSTLSNISPLTEFLSDDERPTLIIEIISSDITIPHLPRVVFQNAAFNSFLSRTVTSDSLDDWLRTLSAGVAFPTTRPVKSFGGRAWSSKRFRNAWRVVYCSQPEDERRLDVVTEALTVPPSPDRETISEASPDVSLVGNHDGHGNDSIIDWTRFPSKVHQSSWIDFVKTYDWDKTALGPISQWPDDLRRLAVLIMSSPDPRMVYWGDDHLIVYNEAAAVLLGQKHPKYAMGNAFVDVWGPEIHEQHKRMLAIAISHGKMTEAKDFEAVLERNGFIEETYWNINLQPCSGPEGQVVAALNEYTESTSAVFHDQRVKFINKISQNLFSLDDLNHLWSRISMDLQESLNDISYALIYVADNPTTEGIANAISNVNTFNLQNAVGVVPQDFKVVVKIDEHLEGPSLGPIFAEARRMQKVVTLRDRDGKLPSELAVLMPDRGFVTTACVLPITSASGQQLAFFVLGMNPRRYFDDELHLFVSHINDVVSKAAAMISLPEEQRRDQEKFEEINSALSQQLRMTALKAEKNEATFSRMAKNSPFGMYMFDADGYPKYVNDAYLKIMGLNRDEFEAAAATGYAWKPVIFEEDTTYVQNLWIQAKEAKAPTTFEYRVKVPAKRVGGPPESRHIECTAFPELDEHGNVVTIQGWLVDISHRKLTESLMAQRLEEALENKRASENFIDMTSHEMRNPLSAILQLADGILTSLTPPSEDIPSRSVSLETIDAIVDAAQTITLCAQHQKCIVDDILTLSKLDSSLLVITPDRVQPAVLMQQALKMYDAELERTNIEASLEVDESFVKAQLDWVMLDQSRTLQVVINLLTNAIKFTQYSAVRKIQIYMSAHEKQPSGDDHRVAFIESRKRQAQVLSTSPDWGAGEEIYLQFAVQDTGKGLTEDEMKLLFLRFSQASRMMKPNECRRPVRIDLSSQASPKTYKQYGGSGLGLFISRELVELQGGQIGVYSEPDVGTTFSFYIKARRCVEALEPRSRQSSLVVPTVTGPVVLPGLTAGKRRRSVAESLVMATPPVQASSPSQNIYVLIVEDNAINAKVMAQQLRKLGCHVYTADHGLHALEFLKTTVFYASSGQVPLSIVLMDLEMPVMDGLTCVRRIRESERLGEIIGHVPVIAITANARSEQINTALTAGMDEVMTKPFRIPELVPRMQALLTKHYGD